MLWITRSHLHLDRVATPWLIARFVDPEARFAFVGWDAEPDENEETAWFGVPGVELSAHDAEGTCFHKVLRRFGLDDPALRLMERVVASGVADALGTPPPDDQTDFEATIGVALNKIGLGLVMVLDDERHLELGRSLYEAVYVLCEIELRPAGPGEDLPPTMPERVAHLRRALGLGPPS